MDVRGWGQCMGRSLTATCLGCRLGGTYAIGIRVTTGSEWFIAAGTRHCEGTIDRLVVYGTCSSVGLNGLC